MPEQGLTDGGLVGDNVAIGIAVPRAKDGVRLSLFVSALRNVTMVPMETRDVRDF